MPYNNMVGREDVQALIPEEVSEAMLTNIQAQSAALTMFQRVNMSSAQQRMPVLSALPVAYFVNGDTGLKQTTKMAWDNKYFNAEEIAAIVAVPEAVVDDIEQDIWDNVRPSLETAIGRALDAAVFFGVNKPGSWPDAIAVAAAATGNTVTRGTASAAEGGIAEDISQLFSLLEDAGQDVTGVIARSSVRGALRGARDSTGQRTQEVTPDNWWGVTNIQYPMRGLWPSGGGTVEAIVGDFSQGMLAVRRDITFKLLDQAVITDGDGAIIFNLPQQDMVAIRVVARYAFQVANPINYDQPEEDARYPFGDLLRPGS